MQDKPVMRLFLERFRHPFFQQQFNLERGCPHRHAGAVANPENMRVNGDGRLTKGFVEDYVGGLPANPGEGFEGFTVARHLTTMITHQNFSRRHDILGL